MAKFYDEEQSLIIMDYKNKIRLGLVTDEDLINLQKQFIEENKKIYGPRYWEKDW